MTGSGFTIESISLAHKFYSPSRWLSAEYANSRPRHGLVYVLDGSAEYEFSDGKKLLVHKDDLLFLPAGVSYLTRCPDEHFTHMTVNFNLRGELRLPTVRNFAENGRVKRDMTKLVEEWVRHMPHYAERSIGLLYLFICFLLDETKNGSERSDGKMNAAIKYLGDNYTKEISISELAASFNMSEAYFRRLFLKQFGMSPLRYLTNLRISHACDLLRDTALSIENICYECGYRDPGYFCRMFKKTLGLTPTEYRIGG